MEQEDNDFDKITPQTLGDGIPKKKIQDIDPPQGAKIEVEEEEVQDGRVAIQLKKQKLRSGFKKVVEDLFVDAFDLNLEVATQSIQQRNTSIYRARQSVDKWSRRFDSQPKRNASAMEHPQRKRNRRSNKNRKQ